MRLRYFLAVAKASSFRAAAESLHIAQPAISRAVQMLEAELGFKLLERTTRRVELTEAGKILARDFEVAMQLIDRSIHNARQTASGEAGEMNIAFSAQTAQGPMVDLVLGFRSVFPQAVINLHALASHDQLRAIEAGEMDVGFLLSAACRPPISHMIFAQERFVLLVSRHHPLAKRKSVALKELAEVPFVAGTMERWETFRMLINSVCVGAGFVPMIAEEADGVPVLLQMVALGRGVTLYGSAITSTLLPNVVAVPVRDSQACFDVSIAWNPARTTPLIREFVSYVKTLRERGELTSWAGKPGGDQRH